MPISDEPFDIRGFNHVALVCSDMQRTVDFYTGVLGFPLVKTLDLPGGLGKHFFFDIGTGTGPQLGFFWFSDGPGPAPGVAAPADFPAGDDRFATATASLNHIAFDVPAERIDEYRERLKAHGVKCSPIVNHDDSPSQHSPHMHEGVHTRSLYFFDPDGILLELASWTRELTEDDVDLPDADGELPTVSSELARSGAREPRSADGRTPFL